jgi:hypothetical protein
MKDLIFGLIYMLIAQIGTFIQLNCGAKYNWYNKYPIMILLLSVPIGWLYIHSVKKLIDAFDGELWPQRILGFGVGIVVFGIMSYFLFKEPFSVKTLISIILALIIIVIQIIF